MTEQHRGPVLGMLAVADPRPQTAIGDWRPFQEGSRLSEIIGRCNDECAATYRSRRWAPEDVEALTELFDLLPYDLSRVNELRSEELATLRFILLDPASLDRMGPAADDVLRRLTQLIDKLPPTRVLYATQVAGPQPAESRASAFATVRVVAENPEFVSSDRELSGFLLRSCQLLQALQTALTSPVQRGGELFDPGYRGRHSRRRGQPLIVARWLLDAALDEQLTVEQASRFARAVGVACHKPNVFVDETIPDRLREAAQAIRSGDSVERVTAQIERSTLGIPMRQNDGISKGDEGRPEDSMFRRDLPEGLREGGRGRNPRLRDGGPFGDSGGGEPRGRGGRGGGRSL